MEEDLMILDNIDEFVNDEMKVVTYKWLSLSLSIHVSKARSLLEEYLKKTESQLDVIYFVGGRRKEGLKTTFQYKLTRQNSLDDAKKTFDDVTTCHIYSIQKSQIKDTDILYAHDVDIVKEHLSKINKYSAIQCESIKNLEETSMQRSGHVPQINGFHKSNDIKPVEKEEIQKPTIVEPKAEKKEKQNAKKATTTKSFFGTKKATGKKTEPTVLKQESISKQDRPSHKVAEKHKEKTTNTKEDQSTVKAHVEKRDISSAFSKSKKPASTRQVESTQVESTATPEVVNSDDDDDKVIAMEEGEDKAIAMEEDEDKVVAKGEDEDIHITNKKEKEDMDVVPHKKGSGKEKTKKRKAVVTDSESDDDNFENFISKSKDPTYKSPEKKPNKEKEKSTASVSEEEVEVLEPTPEPVKKKTKRRKTEKKEPKENLKSSIDVKKENNASKSLKVDQDKKQVESNCAGGKRRGRRMVMKSKQYVDESGFMVTKKEYESESFSDESDTEMPEEKMKTLSPERKKIVEKKKIALDLEKKTKAHLSKPKSQSSLTSFFKKK